MKLVRDIEQHAVAVRDAAPAGPVMALDEPSPDIALVMDRPLFTPPLKPQIEEIAADAVEDVPSDALFNHVYVDKERLAGRIRRALQTRSQVSLLDLVAAHPLEQGLAELVAYVSLAAAEAACVIDDAQRQTVRWTDGEGGIRQARLPMVVFCRPAASDGRPGRPR